MTESSELTGTRRRVVHVSQPTTAGVAACVKMLAADGIASGDQVLILCPAEGALPGWAAEMGAIWKPFPVGREMSLADLRRIPELRRILRSADVVHLHSSKAGALGRLAMVGIRRRPRTVMTPHGWSWYVGGRRAALYRLVERALARSCDALVAVSEGERTDGRAVLGKKLAGRIVVIENGVDTKHYSPTGPTAERSAGPLIVCVGRLSVQKGQDLAIAMLAGLPDASTRLRLVGDGPERQNLIAAATAAGVLDRVEFIASTDPRPHLRAADIVLMPSRWEGMSLLLLEAMACGACIVSSEVGGSDALVGVGVLVPQDDMVSALTAQVVALMSDPDRRIAYGLLARSRATDRYTAQQMLRGYQQLWVR